MRGIRHGFLTAGDDHLGIAAADGLIGQHDGLNTRTTDAVDRCACRVLRQSSIDGCLTCRCLTDTAGEHIAHDHFIDALGVELCSFNGGLDGNGTKLWSREVLQTSQE